MDESQSVEFDKIRTQYYYALYQYAIGHNYEGLQTALKQLTYLKGKEILLIERTEFLALVDTLENQNHLTEITEELRPWYFHTTFLIKQIVE